ncbi:MAG: cytochrome c maturation protein CcmE [Thiotrichales bacterium]|jgi:cytochrome c-type biogenesis protein CcmE|nr:cytochrome c maturation protein CcmE [Thiotrichales bacterium]MBT3613054.1 cytochrome c maturation protein CcmE [Thiotrichales bacterium]MBT3751956.1 cytochrome c maturation protein CcmE [Thiotrichales bacterium]MBT3837660.1 cytochrome c maturation protein CcmE [Thiotrichales bacterium]MBT4152302.1 cytochrome c maturation protein CcmE [Thiotrichales bacterium]
MTSKRKKRLLLILLIIGGVAIAATFMMKALNENINLFYSPTEVVEGKAPLEHTFRLGGMVSEGSVKRKADGGLTVHFDVNDGNKTVTVAYTGILPDLFREEQGIVTLGKLGSDGIFVAEEVLAKHDENYMPPEVAEALEKGMQDGINKMKESAQ